MEHAAAAQQAACLPDYPDDVYQKRMFGIVPTTVIVVLSLLTYGLRIYCRKKTGQGIKADDWLMGLGTLIALEPAICQYILVANGLGHHLCHLTADERKTFGVVAFALQRANQPALACIKVSILLFYLRIFSSERWFRWAAYANMGYTICWAISTWIVNLLVCEPIRAYYDHTIPGAKCKDQVPSGTASAALSLFGDICILALPVPMIWNLKINTRRKVAICGIFLLGVLSCIASAIRISALLDFVPTDASYTQVYTSTWTHLELGIAAISGNLPLLAPLFERFFRRYGTSRERYYESGPVSGGGPPGSHGQSRTDRSIKDSRLFGKEASARTTVTTAVSRREFDRLSDSDSQTQLGAGSDQNIELDDRAILVRTHVDVTTERADAAAAAKKPVATGFVPETSWGPM